MIDFTFNIINPFGDFTKQKILWRLLKHNSPLNNLSIYKYRPTILCIFFNVSFNNINIDIGLFGFSLILDKSW